MSKVSFRERNNPSTPSSGIVNVFIDTSGNLCWQDDTGKIGKLATAGSFTLTIPATGTAALLGTAQTFSAAQTFSNVLTAPGIKPASDSTTAVQIQDAGGTAVLTVDTTNGITYTSVLASSVNVEMAADATIQLSSYVDLRNERGMLLAYDLTSGTHGLFLLHPGAALALIASTGAFSVTENNASTINCYANAGTSWKPTLQNKFAESHMVYLLAIL